MNTKEARIEAKRVLGINGDAKPPDTMMGYRFCIGIVKYPFFIKLVEADNWEVAFQLLISGKYLILDKVTAISNTSDLITKNYI